MHSSDQDHVPQPGTNGDGTLTFMAPEAILTHQFTFETDIWALGCILYELCTLHSPFYQCRTWQEIYKLATTKTPSARAPGGPTIESAVQSAIVIDASAKWPKPYGAWFQLLIDGMLHPDPHERASIGWLVRCPIIMRTFYQNYFDYTNE